MKSNYSFASEISSSRGYIRFPRQNKKLQQTDREFGIPPENRENMRSLYKMKETYKFLLLTVFTISQR